MRIGIDGHYIGRNDSGNERQVTSLIRAFASLDGGHRYSVYVANRGVLDAPPVAAEAVDYRYVGSSPLVRVPLSLPRELRARPVDLLQAAYNAPLFVPCRLVLLLPDISWAVMPHLFPRLMARQIALRARSDVRRAERVVVMSRAMRDEVIAHYRLPDEKVAVVPLGVDGRFRPLDRAGAAAVAERHGVRGPFVLCVGDLQPRKNLPRLLEAFAGLRREGAQHSLVVVGKKAWRYADVFEAVERLGLGDAVTFAGYVPEDDLVAFYNAADLLVYPSLYEGFGFPLLEAMACGTPVAHSDEPTLRETAGDAAVLFDPLDPASIRSAISDALGDAALRYRLREKGLERAREMSWESSARRLIELYRGIVEG